MSPRAGLRKAVNTRYDFRCASGSVAVRREEVWVNEAGEVVWYNLALVHPLTCREDSGRVLGYDNRHGTHERHWMGEAEPVRFTSYGDTLDRFQKELDELRREM